ncbi:MAG TPA: Holliday junction branch migration protein RuvA [Hanamia sp.]|nr:Holliday junction branch migration protein RuvA [Hanamia sp.]
MNYLFLALLRYTMIAYLSGKFAYKSPALVYMDVMGVGYEVNISLNTYSHIQHLTDGKLFTYLQVKEDSHTLYGFFDALEKEMFVLLISVSGVGAATARMMLSNMKPQEIGNAIVMNNALILEGVKGIGKKTAQRLVLELKDKVSKLSTSSLGGQSVGNTLEQDALNALIALGISRPAGEQAIKKIVISEPSINSLEILIKKALKAI